MCLAQTDTDSPVAYQGKYCGGGSVSVACQFPEHIVSGDTIGACGDWINSNGQTWTLTDTFLDTFTYVGTITSTGGGNSVNVKCGYTTAGSTGTNTITNAYSLSTNMGLHLFHLKGDAGFDVSCTTTAGAVTSITNTCTTTLNNELLISFAAGWSALNFVYCDNYPQMTLAGNNSLRGQSLCWGQSGVAGSNSVTMKSNGGQSALAMITLAFKAPTMRIVNNLLADGAIGDPYHYFIKYVGGNGTVTYSTVSGLPSWASINSSTGEITGTPTTVGTSSINFKVDDGTHNATKTLNLTTGSSLSTPAFVNYAHNSLANNTVTINNVQKNEELIIAFNGQQTTGSTSYMVPIDGSTNFISDTMGITFHRVYPVVILPGNNSGNNSAIVHIVKGKAPACGNETITINLDSSVGGGNLMFVKRISGVQDAVDNGVDLLNQTGLTSVNATTPNLTTLVANELLQSTWENSNATDTMTLNSSFITNVPQFAGSGTDLINGDKQVTTATTYNSNMTMTCSGSCGSAVQVAHLFGLRPAIAAPVGCASTNHASQVY